MVSDGTEPQCCIFCAMSPERIMFQNDLAYATRDSFPVTEMHSLIIPKRHLEDYFSLTMNELLACNALLHLARQEIQDTDRTVEGFNIGVNSGGDRRADHFSLPHSPDPKKKWRC